MVVYVNGEFVPEEHAKVSVFDRGFLYGDACFETLRVYDGMPGFWKLHLKRLRRTLEFLKISAPFDDRGLAVIVKRLIDMNDLPDAVLRIQVTRGTGQRGYSCRSAIAPALVVSVHPLTVTKGLSGEQTRYRVKTSRLRIDSKSPLGTFKTGNKLLQILGKREAEEAGVEEVLLRTADGFVAEASAANVFWFEAETLLTPPLELGVLPGVTRQIVSELWRNAGRNFYETRAHPSQLQQSDGVILTQSVGELITVSELDGHPIPPHPAVAWLASAYRTRARSTDFDVETNNSENTDI